MAAPIQKSGGVGDSGTSTDLSIFVQIFKYYKRRKPPPNLSGILDFKNCDKSKKVYSLQLSSPCTIIEGVKPVEEWEAYTHHDFPGFVFICNPFKPGCDKYWVKRCLSDFPSKPNVCNLDAHFDLPSENLWELKKSGQADVKGKAYIDKLRWVTLGYHHNWEKKDYSLEKHSAFPEDLSLLSRHVASALGVHDYRAEASVVNYYHQHSTLCGHTDHSEFDKEAPLISFSFGLPAVFLVGGLTKSVTPMPILLRNGDITILMNESRLAYHAVPRILTLCEEENLSSKAFENSGISCSSEGQGVGCEREENNHVNETSSVLNTSSTDRQCDADHSNKLKSDDASGSASAEHQQFKDKAHKPGELITNEVINAQILTTLDTMEWMQYEDYVKHNRINMNVRQVFVRT